MTKPIPSAGEAVPKNDTANEQFFGAMMSLESPVIDLAHMADLSVEALCDALDRPDKYTDDGRMVFHLSKDHRDRLLFAACDVSSRASALRRQYTAGMKGEVTP